MKQKNKESFTKVSKHSVILLTFLLVLLLLVSCKIEEKPVQKTQQTAVVIDTKEIKLTDAKTELINLIDKAADYQDVMLGMTEKRTLNNTVQEKTTNLSYSKDAIKIINNLEIKEEKEGISYTTTKETGMELIKNNTYTQCILDFENWVCEESKITKEKIKTAFDEIKDKNFVNTIQDVTKISDSCFLINNELTDCYDEEGFLISSTKKGFELKKEYVKFEKDNFELPENVEFTS